MAELLKSYIVGLQLPSGIYRQLSVYLDLLLRWNAKTNLTAIRDPEQIVTRHFGESLFAAGVLFSEIPKAAELSSRAAGEGPAFSDSRQPATDNLLRSPEAPLIPSVGTSGTEHGPVTLADLGSGAGFPGLPIKLAVPSLQVTLIESQNKKAVFLKEVIRTLKLEGIEVYSGRAEQWGKQADTITLRAVEKFESILPLAASLVAPGGRVCLLVGAGQRNSLARLGFNTEVEKYIPDRSDSMVVVGNL